MVAIPGVATGSLRQGRELRRDHVSKAASATQAVLGSHLVLPDGAPPGCAAAVAAAAEAPAVGAKAGLAGARGPSGREVASPPGGDGGPGRTERPGQGNRPCQGAPAAAGALSRLPGAGERRCVEVGRPDLGCRTWLQGGAWPRPSGGQHQWRCASGPSDLPGPAKCTRRAGARRPHWP